MPLLLVGALGLFAGSQIDDFFESLLGMNGGFPWIALLIGAGLVYWFFVRGN